LCLHQKADDNKRSGHVYTVDVIGSSPVRPTIEMLVGTIFRLNAHYWPIFGIANAGEALVQSLRTLRRGMFE
jgi:hypothetical protein